MALFSPLERMFAQKTVENAREAAARQQRENEQYRRGDITQTELMLRSAGNLADATVGNVAGQMMQPVLNVAGAVIPDAVSGPIKETVGSGLSYMNQNYPRASRNLGAAMSAADAVLPVAGTSMVKQSARRVDELTGPESGRGMLTASANNVIPGYYGGNKPLSIATWMPDQVINTAKDMVSPTSRATYREQGFTKSNQKTIAQARARESFIDSWTKIPGIKQVLSKTGLDEYMSGSMDKGTHRGIAQAQYLGRVHAQSKRKGKSVAIDEIMRRSDIVETFEYYPGAYADTVRNQKLMPYYKGAKKQMPVKLPEEDLDFIEQHFSTAWTEPSLTDPNVMVPFREADKPLIAIKNPGMGKGDTGRHFADVLLNAPYVSKVDNIFEGQARVSPEELLVKLRAASDASQKLREDRYKFKVVRQSEDGGVWVTGSRPGSAITEGGINYLTKITPDGKMIGIMSDEHNLFEGIAAKIEQKTGVPSLTAMKHLLPKRLIAVTPPMVIEVGTKTSKKREYEQAKPEKAKTTHISVLDSIIDYKPSKEVLAAEQRKNVGGMLTAGGLTSAGIKQQEEEQ